MVIDFVHQSLTISNVPGFRTDIYVHAKDNVKIRRVIKAAKNIIIPPHSVIKILIKMKEDSESLINNRNYLFKPNHSGAYYHLIDTDFSFV